MAASVASFSNSRPLVVSSMSSTSFPLEDKTLRYSIVIPCMALTPKLKTYLRHRIQKEILYRIHPTGYVTHIYSVDDHPHTTFIQQPFHGDMLATVSCQVSVFCPEKKQQWTVTLKYTDPRMGVWVSTETHPPLMITVLNCPHSEAVGKGRQVTVTVLDVRMVLRENRIRAVVEWLADVPEIVSADSAAMDETM